MKGLATALFALLLTTGAAAESARTDPDSPLLHFQFAPGAELVEHVEDYAVPDPTFTIDAILPCTQIQADRCWYKCDSKPGMRKLVAVQCQADTSEDGSGGVTLLCTCWRERPNCNVCFGNDPGNPVIVGEEVF